MTEGALLDRSESPYAQATWRALGTYVELVVADRALLADARALAEQFLDDVDRSYSRFRDDSDLMRANACAGSWVRVGRLLVDAVDVALDAARRSDGLVDPTLGLPLVALGYDRDLADVRAGVRADVRADVRAGVQADVQADVRADVQADVRAGVRGPGAGPADLPAVPARSGAWREVRTDPGGAVLVPFGVALDLGATGKAFAADRITAAIVSEVGTDCVLSLGGDVAVGTQEGSPGHPWRIAICERPDDDPAQTLTLHSGGLATSTTTFRRWTHQAATVHHLLDPATGRPVERTWRTASVIADSCVAANTASTAAIVLGDGAPAWLAGHQTGGLAARLVSRDGTVVTVGAWPAPPATRDTVGD